MKKDAPPGKKQTKKAITLEQKVDIIRRYGRGKSISAIRNALHLPESTLWTIQKDKEKIMAAFKARPGSASTWVSSGQSTFMICLEKMLVTWMDHCKHQGLNVTFNDTKKEAMDFYQHLKEEETGSIPDFVASMGRFYKFKNSYAFRSVKCSGEARSAGTNVAASYPDELRAIIEEGGYKPQQVFNMDETGLQWKNMPDHTYIMREEKSAPG